MGGSSLSPTPKSSTKNRLPQNREDTVCFGIYKRGGTKISIKFDDPEATRFYRKYPKYPGLRTCLTLLRNRNANAVWIDLICWEMWDHVADDVEETVAAFHDEPDEWVRILLLCAVAEACCPEFMPLLQENLASQQESLSFWAEAGLKNIDTKEARTVLWHFGQNS